MILSGLSRGIARLIKLLSPTRCAWGRRHLELAFGETHSADERERILDASLAHFTRITLETVLNGSWNDQEHARRVTCSPDCAERFHAAFAAGRGVIAVSAHLGNWEMGSRWFARATDQRVHVVAKDLRPAWLDRLATRRRESQGARVIKKQEAARGVLTALRRGDVVCLLMDQNRPDGVFAEFFGRPAGTSALAPALAQRTGATLLPVACLANDDGTYRLVIEEPISLDGVAGSREEMQLEGARRCNRALESLIRLAPEQWLWTHRRYKACAPGQESLKPLF